MRATRPQGWLFNLLARRPQGVEYEVLESIQPVIESGLTWPLEIRQYATTNVFAVGSNSVTIATPTNRHRVYLSGVWYADNTLIYKPGAQGLFQAFLGLPTSPLASHPFCYYRLAAASSLDIPDKLPWVGSNAFAHVETQTGIGSMKPLYAPPGSFITLQWTQGVVANVFIAALYVEEDQNVPLGVLL